MGHNLGLSTWSSFSLVFWGNVLGSGKSIESIPLVSKKGIDSET
jgi:hypothetical protein